ncbi:MAG: hypothetical protein ACRDGV_06920 [Candidatus Limnocylindria bacterium]
MATYQSPLTVIIKGAIAGAAGTAIMGAAMERAPKLLEQMGVKLPPAPQAPTAPDSPTEATAKRLAEGVAEQPIDEETKATGGQVVHWAYGAGWGAFYGIMQSSLKLPHLVHGTLFGALVGGVATFLVPRIGLQVPPSENPQQLNVFYMGSHLVYGWATAIVYAILNLGRRG